MSTRRQMHKVSIRARHRKEKKLWADAGPGEDHGAIWSRGMAPLKVSPRQLPNWLSPQGPGGAGVRKQKAGCLRLESLRCEPPLFYSLGAPGPRLPGRARWVCRLARGVRRCRVPSRDPSSVRFLQADFPQFSQEPLSLYLQYFSFIWEISGKYDLRFVEISGRSGENRLC
jgi:hypothetical protein